MRTAPRRRGSFFLRHGRTSTTGHVYLVTFTTHGRQRLFTDFAMATMVCRAIEDPRLWGSSQLLAWVLMPDHWHGIIRLGGADRLSAVVQRLKANSARQLRREQPQVVGVWASGFHDHALRADEDLKDAARYVIRNPVTAGLVRRVGEYPYWDVAWI